MEKLPPCQMKNLHKPQLKQKKCGRTTGELGKNFRALGRNCQPIGPFPAFE
jgi:hypothetical protein